MEDKDTEKMYYIPKNFHNGISILGTTYDTVYVLQAAVFVIPGWIISFVVLPKISFLSWMDFSAKLSVAILWSAIFGYLCINGIQEKPLIQYIKDVKSFRKSTKKAIKNPELILKNRPIYTELEEEELLPRDKIYKMVEKYREKQKTKDMEDISKIAEGSNDKEIVYIFDDNMNAKEYKKYLKKIRKEEAKLNGRSKNRKSKSDKD